MRKLILVAAVLAMPVTNAFALSLTFNNSSDWEIHELYFGKSSDEEWGKDFLGKNVIEPGAGFQLTGVDPGKWDLKLVDEDGDACTVLGVKIAASEDVTITNDMLLGCQKNTAEEDDEE